MQILIQLLSRNLDLVRRARLLGLAKDVDVPEGRVRRLDVVPPALLAAQLAQRLVVRVRDLDLLEVRLDACCDTDTRASASVEDEEGRREEGVQGVTLFGMTENPRFAPHAMSTCAGVALSLVAISLTSGYSVSIGSPATV